MIRKIIQIDESRCDGCGLCANACHEGAIAMIDGKAKLIRDDYCDGLGDCLPACPQNAITFVEREAAAYDAEAVKAHLRARQGDNDGSCGCAGSAPKAITHQQSASNSAASQQAVPSRLGNWPVQIKLAPIHAPYFDGAHLLIAADCSAYACGAFHQDFIEGRVALIGCPKLDSIDYSEKLAALFAANDIASITLTRMEVPCCGGLERMVKDALAQCGKSIPLKTVTLSLDGKVL